MSSYANFVHRIYVLLPGNFQANVTAIVFYSEIGEFINFDTDQHLSGNQNKKLKIFHDRSLTMVAGSGTRALIKARALVIWPLKAVRNLIKSHLNFKAEFDDAYIGIRNFL